MNNLIKTNGNRNVAPRAWDVMPFGASSPLMQMERLLDDMFAGFGLPTHLAMPAVSTFAPKLDVSETDKAFAITAELPGLTEQDINVEVNGDVLTLSGEKRSEHEDNAKGVYRMERSYGRFQRQFTIPANVDAAKVDATFKNGVLHITLPKTAENKPATRKIAVKS